MLLFIIRDAIARGDLKPGGTIVEGTAGNTGIGLAMACAVILPKRFSVVTLMWCMVAINLV